MGDFSPACRTLGPIRLSLHGPDIAKANAVLHKARKLDAILFLPIGGPIRLGLQLGSIEIRAGAATLIPWDDDLHFNAIQAKCYVAQIPLTPWLDQPLANVSALILDSTLEQAAILRAFLALLLSIHAWGDEAEQEALGLGLGELIRQGFSNPNCFRMDQTGRDITKHADLMPKIQAWIHTQLRNKDFGPTQITERYYISRTTLYELFKSYGGVRSYIQSQRLILARKELESPDNKLLPISLMATQLGFNCASSFTRAFKRYWNRSPKSVRASAHLQNFDQDDVTGKTSAKQH